MSCYPADSGTCAANGASTARRGRAQAPRPALALLALMMALAPFGDTEYTPAMPAIAHALGADYGMVQLTVVFAVYVIRERRGLREHVMHRHGRTG
ncbi:hypothetical protein ACFWZU_06550 [Frateuria sp. GZRR33]|uniref:hypothetical protein n=1 Tax=Frateuria sp. GZRR33 TaxID=3351535 RepID=UPI003EDBE6C5